MQAAASDMEWSSHHHTNLSIPQLAGKKNRETIGRRLDPSTYITTTHLMVIAVKSSHDYAVPIHLPRIASTIVPMIKIFMSEMLMIELPMNTIMVVLPMIELPMTELPMKMRPTSLCVHLQNVLRNLGCCMGYES